MGHRASGKHGLHVRTPKPSSQSAIRLLPHAPLPLRAAFLTRHPCLGGSSASCAAFALACRLSSPCATSPCMLLWSCGASAFVVRHLCLACAWPLSCAPFSPRVCCGRPLWPSAVRPCPRPRDGWRGRFSAVRFFNQDIGKWDVSRVRDMHYMFNEASAFNQGIGSWRTGNVGNLASLSNTKTKNKITERGRCPWIRCLRHAHTLRRPSGHSTCSEANAIGATAAHPALGGYF